MKSRFPASWQVIGRSFVDWWDSWFSLLGIVLLWVVAQFTIVLGPPATFGLYYAVNNLLNGEFPGMRDMIEGGRKYFGAAWLWNVINLLVLFILYINIQFYSQMDVAWRVLPQIVVVILSIMWLVGQFYALPFFHELQEPRVLLAIRNGVFMGLASPFFTFPLILFAVVIVFLNIVLLLPIFMSVPAIVPLLGARAVQNRLIAFGIRKREQTPREIEREASGRIKLPPALEVTDREGQVKE